MKLTKSFREKPVEIAITVPTVVEPGDRFIAAITLKPNENITLEDLSWETPGIIYKNVSDLYETLPVAIEAGTQYSFDVEFYTSEGSEGLGEIKHLLHINTLTDSTIYSTVDHWISVFTSEEPSISQPLSDEFRDRLISVVNARTQNGHIFLADSVGFFRDYLNLHIPKSFAAQLYEIFGVSPDELPVVSEKYQDFRRGILQFYGIDELILLAEEDCEESDDRFDVFAMKEF